MGEAKRRSEAVARGEPDPGPSSPNPSSSTRRGKYTANPKLNRKQRRVYEFERRNGGNHEEALAKAARAG